MEEITADRLQGILEGVVTGAASLVVGKKGKALYTNGVDQWVNFGNQRHRCLGNLTVCHNGFVMALWLKAHRYDDQGISDEYYLSSGGHSDLSVGVCVLMQNSKLVVSVRNESVTWYGRMIPFTINIWNHVALTWSRTGGGQLHVYVNGEQVAEDLYGSNILSNRQPAWSDFVIGSVNHPTSHQSLFAGEMSIDELRIWDAIFDPNEIKQIYENDLMSKWVRIHIRYHTSNYSRLSPIYYKLLVTMIWCI